MAKSWIVDVQENEKGEYFIEFPPESIEELGWKEGDTVEWNNNKDGSYTLKKVEDSATEWVLVETMSAFRIRYLVEVPHGKQDWALDTVTMQEAKEFSQKHIDEIIMTHRVVSKEEALQICDEDNEYTIAWSDEQKINNFFTKKEEYKK